METLPGYDLIINKDFFECKPPTFLDRFRDAILEGSVVLPSIESGVYLPWMGTTKRKASPAALKIPSPDGGYEMFEIFSKPFTSSERKNAFDEMKNASVAKERGINTPPMICLINIDQEPVLISELIKNVIPLSAMDLTFRETNLDKYSPCDLLKEFVPFIANMHNKGLAHHDLHLGQVGYQLKEAGTEKIVFDLENACRLNNKDLWYNYNYVQSCEVPPLLSQDNIITFERDALEDIAEFTAWLRKREFPLDQHQLINTTAEIYHKNRFHSFGFVVPSESFKKKFRGDLYERHIQLMKHRPSLKSRNDEKIYCFDKILKHLGRRAS